MAAEIKPVVGPDGVPPSAKKPVLLHRLEGHSDTVYMVRAVPGEDVVISVSEDKTVRVWLKRDTGQYWPSICHTMPSPATSMDYHPASRRLFVGMENGTITDYVIQENYSRLSLQRTQLSHQGRVVALRFDPQVSWIMSCARDKTFVWHSTQNGEQFGVFQCSGWCTALEYDDASRHAFIGDYSGQIAMIKLSDTGFTPVTTLKGHAGSVSTLLWEPVKKLLVSGGFDQVIIVWDIGGKQGTAYELQGHHQKVTGLCHHSPSNTLLSASEDSTLVMWDMNAKRIETPEWRESDACQRCVRPFFWNVKAMMDQKVIGLRQHHCRKCGNAVCERCSSNKTTIPVMGFEFEVRVCDECHLVICDQERTSLASFYEMRHSVVHMYLDAHRGHLLTAGADRIIKLWDVSNLLQKGMAHNSAA